VVCHGQQENDLAARVAELVEHRVSVVLHEIRQPLSVVFVLAEMARSSPGVPADVRARLDELIEQAQEVAWAACSVLDAAAEGAGDGGPVDLDEVLGSVLHGFRLTWSGTLRRGGVSAPLFLAAPRATLRRCLVNIVENAVRAAGPAGSVTVTVLREGDTVRVVVDDDGPGFGRGPRGTGLGIGVVREALRPLEGVLTIGTAPSTRGTRVELTLPVGSAGDRRDPLRVPAA